MNNYNAFNIILHSINNNVKSSVQTITKTIFCVGTSFPVVNYSVNQYIFKKLQT